MSGHHDENDHSFVGVERPDPVMWSVVAVFTLLAILGVWAFVGTGRIDSLVGLIPVACLSVAVLAIVGAIIALFNGEAEATLWLLLIALIAAVIFLVLGPLDLGEILNDTPWEVRP